MKPLSGQVAMLGGGVGCTEGACAEVWAELLEADGETGRLESLHAANGEFTVVFDVLGGPPAVAVASVILQESWRDDSPPPGAPSTGVRAGAAAYLGLSWDVAQKQWWGAPSLVTWGGTFQQDVAPTQNVVVDGPYLETVTHEYWPGVEMFPDSDPVVGEVGPCLREVDLLAGTTTDLPGFVFWAHDGAMVAMSADRLVTFGGVDISGGTSEWLRVYDDNGTLIGAGELEPTWGLGGALDPISGKVWFFGNLLGVDELPVNLLAVTPDSRPVFDSTPSFEIHHWEGRLAIQDPEAADPLTEVGPWWAETGFVITLDCAAPEGCATQTVVLELPPQIDVASDAFDVELVLPPADDPLSPRVSLLADHQLLSVEANGSRQYLFRSPVTLVNDVAGPAPQYGIVVTAELLPAIDNTIRANDTVQPTWTTFGHPVDGICAGDPSFPQAESWVLSTHWWTRLADGDLAQSHLATDEPPFGGVLVGSPNGMVAVGPAYDPGCATTTMRLLAAPDPATESCFDLAAANAAEIDLTFTVDIRQDTEYAGDGGTAHFWVDTCLDSEVRDIVDGWITGAGDFGYQGDLAFLEARIGTSTSTAPTGIWIGRPEVRIEAAGFVEHRGGDTLGLNVRLYDFEGDGTLGAATLDGLAQSLDSTATHELAHLVLQHRVYVDPAVQWFKEGPAGLLGYERQPGAEPQRLYEGLFQRVNAFLFDDNIDIQPLRNLSIPPDPTSRNAANLTRERNYAIGPYLLAQISATSSGNESITFWNQLRDDLVSEPYVAPYTTAQLENLIDVELALSGQYDARVLGLSFGEPLLGITSYDLDGGATGTVRIEQVQTHLLSNLGLPFVEFTSVPYALGCQTLDGGLAFVECGATGQDWLGPMGVLTGPSADLTLTSAGGVDTDTADTGVLHSTQAVWVALLANSRVLPGAMPTYGILDPTDAPPASFLDTPSAPTWLLSCGRGSATAYDCSSATPDLDGDGHRLFGDCVDIDVAIYPGATDPIGPEWATGDLDLNCDGWPADFWIPPPTLTIP